MNGNKSYYLGLDIGTDSVGYAVTNEQYNLLKHKGEPMWGVHLFDEVSSNEERRGFRTARRRLERRQQRVQLVQELFASAIAEVDEHFYRRIKESALWREDAHEAHCLFDSPDYSDADYHKQFPTIHHLICKLMCSTEPYDVRLVYLACAWLVAHRGHFLLEVSKDNIDAVRNIKSSYCHLMEWFENCEPWKCDHEAFGAILKKKLGVNAKYKELCNLLFSASKAPKMEPTEDGVYYSIEHILKLLCGGSVSAKDLFGKEEYTEIASFSLDKPDDELAQVLGELGDDAELVIRLKALFDWAILADILTGSNAISQVKVGVYEQHKSDLALLKQMVRKYIPGKYREVFREEDKSGYAFYSKSGKQEDFCKYLKGIFKGITPDECDAAEYKRMLERIEENAFCPKQVNSNNRVIPYQLYWIELKQILDNACTYLPFLNEADADGYVTKDKLLAIMEYRVPYFVGPLKEARDLRFNHWMVRKAEGKIYPWNFAEKVDLDSSEQAFITRMTNKCTYLPYADVLPKCSLLHERFQVLNEINTLRVNGQKIPVEVKQKLYHELFTKRKKVTVKSIKTYLARNGFYTESELETFSGIDETIKSSLSSYIAFKRLLDTKQLTEADAEEIIRHSTYTEDKVRFAQWLGRYYPELSDEDRKYISRLKFKEFARLSKELLCAIFASEKNSETGEAMSIIDRMWNENLNLMEILSERFGYCEVLQAEKERYYLEYPKSIDARMKEMYLSDAVKRPIIRALDVVSDVVKVNGCAPRKIFIEMARGGTPENKGKRTKSRYQQLKELYAKCELEDVRDMEERLDSMGEERDNRLQSEKLFLYYLQLGKSMYSGKTIDLERLSDKSYDIDHIYPQSKVKDDSILNNKVLVLSEENGAKGDRYPIDEDIRRKMHGWWKLLLEHGFITAEKYKRLVRYIPFDENEEWGFINRQLVETRQSTKAAATLLKEKYPEAEIVYVKAGLVSEFRQEFDLLKSRTVNDLHHAKDAYLNIVVGNVYSGQFTYNWFLKNRDTYNLKIKTLFSRHVKVDGQTIWNGSESIGKIKNIIQNKNAIHLTCYSFRRKGGFFHQQPESAAEGLVPRKAGLPSEKYGGYNNKTATAFVLAQFTVRNKKEVMLVVIDLLFAKCMENAQSAFDYVKKQIEDILEKPISDLQFPLGLRLIKINTIFELDGIRMSLASKSNKGRTLVFSVTTALVVGYSKERYIKQLDRYYEKKKEHPNMKYSKAYDQISVEENIELYSVLTDKLQNSIFRLRPGNPLDTLQQGKESFAKLDIDTQVKVLLQIVSVFGRTTSSCDLSAIGGKAKTATPTLSSSVSNWKKHYADVRIIDQSASGLFESRSGNLLELL